MKRSLIASVVAVFAAAVLAAPAQALVNAGHSGWEWGSPTPQGNQINDIGFNGGIMYAVGNFGTVLASPDGGSTWTGITTGITPDINKVSVPATLTIVIGGGCSARISNDGGGTFQRLPFSATDTDCAATLTSQSFPSTTAGFLLLSDGSILSTSDGGGTFARKTAVPNTQAGGGGALATDITFTSATNGFAVTSTGNIYRTTDGANTWSPVFNGSNALNSIVFADANTGYAVGANSAVIKSSDGGASWSSKPGAVGPNGALTLTKIRCANASLCLIVNDQGTGLVRTEDGGSTYTFVVPANSPIYAAAFANSSRAVAAGAGGATFVSNDGGKNFTPVGSSLPLQLTGLRAESSSFAVAWGRSGAFAATPDGGATWTAGAVSTTSDLVGMDFPAANDGFALDDAGGLFRTTNGGVSWAILNTGTRSHPNTVVAPDTNTVVLVGPRGVRRSSNGGNQFSAVSGKLVAKAVLNEADHVGGTIFAYGPSSILYSTNGGASWKSISRPKSGRRFLSLDDAHCTSTRACWALVGDTVLRTANGGRTWTNLSANTGDNTIDELAPASATSAYAIVAGFAGIGINTTTGSSGGWVLHTADGGRTWAPQLLGPSVVSAVAPTFAGTDFALADSNQLFQTTTGGNQGQQSALTIRPSVRTIRKRTKITLTIALSPASGGEQVLLSPTRGRSEVLTIASNGTATYEATISKTTGYVAQWAGDADTNGDGSPVLTIKRK